MMKVCVGIDVSKATLDVAILHPSRPMECFCQANTPAGHKKIIQRVRQAAKGCEVHWCMESTASCHWDMALTLAESGALVSVENPRRVKNYGLAIGAVQKTDRADSKVIARYCQDLCPAPMHLPPPHIMDLSCLDRRITDLRQMITRESNRLEDRGLAPCVAEGIKENLLAFKRQIEHLSRKIEEIVRENAELKEEVWLLTTVPGMAFRSAASLAAHASGLDRFDCAQDLAAHFGLNPRLKRSGTSLHGRTAISKAGNSHVRSLLYMPALVAQKHNPVIKAFYEKLIREHKPPKSALTACERKLVMICYGALKSKKPFDPSHCS